MGPPDGCDRLDAADRRPAQRTVLLDVRWALGDPHGREHYLAEHLPGAVFVDLRHGTGRPGGPRPRPPPAAHPGPVPGVRARAGASASGDVVVAYDDSGNMAAARLWWMLRNAGLRRASTCSTAAWPPGATRDSTLKAASGRRNLATSSRLAGGGPCP